MFDKAAAIDQLPNCPGYRKDTDLGQQRLWATGTDDARSAMTCGDELGEHLVEQSAGETCQNTAQRGERYHNQDGDGDNAQVLTLSRNNNRQRLVAATGESEVDGTRTRNHWIDSPVL